MVARLDEVSVIRLLALDLLDLIRAPPHFTIASEEIFTSAESLVSLSS